MPMLAPMTSLWLSTLNGTSDQFDQARGERPGLLLAAELDDRELVAAEPSDLVAFAKRHFACGRPGA